MTVEVRKIRPEEHEEAGRVTSEAYREFAPQTDQGWATYLDRVADVRGRSEHAVILGAVDDGRVLGTVTLELNGRIPGGHPRPELEPDQANVRMLGVAREARRRGLARALMEACIAEAHRAGKRRLTLDTAPNMVAAHHLYGSMGFRRLPDMEWPDGFRLLAFELDLSLDL